MGVIMKETMQIIEDMVMEFVGIQTEKYMKVNGRLIKELAEERLSS